VFADYHFTYPTLLTGFHFIFTFLGLCACAAIGLFRPKPVSIRDIIPLSLSFVGFVVFNNLSLQHNSVGSYQLMKVLTTPVIVVIQAVFFHVPLHYKLKLALLPICIGVCLASGADTAISQIGLFHAVCGIISTSFYQIWVKSKQQDLQLDSYQLLFLQAPVSAVMVFMISFATEDVYGEKGWANFDYSFPSLSAIVLSCTLAFLVNLSIFMVIGKTSPIAYNVLGHFKLCVVLLTGFLYFNEEANSTRVLGTIITFVGVVVYSTLQQNISNGWDNRKTAAPATAASNTGAEDKLEAVPLTKILLDEEAGKK